MLYYNFLSKKIPYSKVERLKIEDFEGKLLYYNEISTGEITDEDVIIACQTGDGYTYFLTNEEHDSADEVIEIIEEHFDVKIVNEYDHPEEFKKIYSRDYVDDFHRLIVTCGKSIQIIYLPKTGGNILVDFIVDHDIPLLFNRDLAV